jgi:hypothetical protein
MAADHWVRLFSYPFGTTVRCPCKVLTYSGRSSSSALLSGIVDRCYKRLAINGTKIYHPGSRPVKGQRLTISLRWNDTFRRFGALFQHSHVRQGKVRHPTVFKHLR